MAAVQTPDEFKTAMQQLSAEAAKLLPVDGHPNSGTGDSARQIGGLRDRLIQMEKALYEKMEYIADRISRSSDVDLAKRFGKIEEQLTAIRESDQMNARMVDTLHSELNKYRDNFIHESLQKPFIHDLVHLFDDLTALSDQMRTATDQIGIRGQVVSWRENLENAIDSLLEVLHRLEVREIEPKDKIDRALHKVISYEPAEFAEDDGRIVMRLRRGFVWRGTLIRPEEVIAKRFG